MENGSFNLPDPVRYLDLKTLDGCLINVMNQFPMYVADDAFPLGRYCMKLFPQSILSDRNRIFNYRLSRMRRISENVFGIWGNTFHVSSLTLYIYQKNYFVVLSIYVCTFTFTLLAKKFTCSLKAPSSNRIECPFQCRHSFISAKL